ncbi:helix-turn-helix transcriptional regulator [Oryzomonas japonica]|uniref:Helix-turn-helix transcriptional regulator n=1 Tax=Oryzomonas japonica TaxID=2603858 RepID=A0A7J4ZPU3_9BACT|nr:metalloregulator ArsR/SmtB family transcription factor [Oryzomonas japonica]KAB0665046.1 helix-turn-helix transcriptional regulator [Oryzomonas japonica]
MDSVTHYLADVLKSIAQPTRLKIIEFLRDGEKCVCEIFPAIGEEQSNTSRHLNYMHNHGILSRRKDGVKILYVVKHPEVFQIADLAATICANETKQRTRALKGK